jgi:hypothetical protein
VLPLIWFQTRTDQGVFTLPINAKFDSSCKVCQKNWNTGDPIFYQKDPKAICCDEECYKSQGGTNTFTKKSNNGFGKIYTRTTEDKLKDVGSFYDFIQSKNIVEEIEPYSLAMILASVYNGQSK